MDESPVLAEIVGASVQGRVALGQRAGARVRRLVDTRDTAAVTSRGPRQAHLDGFARLRHVARVHGWGGLRRRALMSTSMKRLVRDIAATIEYRDGEIDRLKSIIKQLQL